MGRNGLGALRQTFFVNRGGWDHHSETLALQQDMLEEVDDAIEAFWAQLVALGMANQVTLFTGSDFGRTLTSNDRGSDHVAVPTLARGTSKIQHNFVSLGL